MPPSQPTRSLLLRHGYWWLNTVDNLPEEPDLTFGLLKVQLKAAKFEIG